MLFSCCHFVSSISKAIWHNRPRYVHNSKYWAWFSLLEWHPYKYNEWAFFSYCTYILMIVQEALRTRGLKDDTTCIVVDIIPPDNTVVQPPPPVKKPNKFRALLCRKRSHDAANKLSNKLSAVNIVEELFEEGSAMLAERFVIVTL